MTHAARVNRLTARACAHSEKSCATSSSSSSARDGGALVDLANDGDGGTRVETKFNRFVCFQVPRLHRVEAVRARDKVRHSIFGWWYRPATEDEIPSDFYDDEEEEDEEVEEEEEEEEEERGEERDKKNGSKRRRRA